MISLCYVNIYLRRVLKINFVELASSVHFFTFDFKKIVEPINNFFKIGVKIV